MLSGASIAPGESERRALVTGGAGFIGSTLVDRLLAEGWQVTALDSFDEFYPEARKYRHLEGARSNERFTLVRADVRDGDATSAALEDARPHVVFDLAAKAGVRPSIADPDAYISTNVAGLQKTLSAVKMSGARLVFASSSSVYGAEPHRPFAEDQAGMRPLSPYGATKVAGEALCHAHHVATGLPVGIARLFTVYGPRQRPDLAIHEFARRIWMGEPVRLFDQGTGLRDYTFVDDVVDALIRLAAVDVPFLTVNIGSHAPVVTNDVVTLLEELLGIPAHRELLPPQPGDVPATHADVSRAKEYLAWEPRTAFRDGMAEFVEWLTDESNASGARAS